MKLAANKAKEVYAALVKTGWKAALTSEGGFVPSRKPATVEDIEKGTIKKALAAGARIIAAAVTADTVKGKRALGSLKDFAASGTSSAATGEED